MIEYIAFLQFIIVFVVSIAVTSLVVLFAKGVKHALIALTVVSSLDDLSDELAADFSNSIKWN